MTAIDFLLVAVLSSFAGADAGTGDTVPPRLIEDPGVAYPADVGAVADRVFVGDADGRLWKVDVSSPNPSNWKMKVFFDAFPGGTNLSKGAADGHPIQTPPILSVDDRGNITTFNAAAERMFGYSAAAVLGKNVSMLMTEPNRSSHDEYLRNYAETGEARIIGIGREVEARRADGSVFTIRLAVGEAAADLVDQIARLLGHQHQKLIEELGVAAEAVERRGSVDRTCLRFHRRFPPARRQAAEDALSSGWMRSTAPSP